MPSTSDQRPSECTLGFLRDAFPSQWRVPALGYVAVEAWEAENEVVLPEPYRTFVAEISNGSPFGPAGEDGLQPLGHLPDAWPVLRPRRPGQPFPLEEAWYWSEDPNTDYDDPRIDAAFHDGSIVLGSEDGESFWLLLTTGPCRGEVWMVAQDAALPAPGEPTWDFEEWVRCWHTGRDWWY